MYNNINSVLYGFEDYKIYYIGIYYLMSDYASDLPYRHIDGGSIFVPSDIIDYKLTGDQYGGKVFKYQDKKEKLHDGCKLYVHPLCKLSRSLLAEKYKRCLNPWEADVVVIPDHTSPIYPRDVILFSNDDKKMIIMVNVGCGNPLKHLKEEDSLLDAYKTPPSPNSLMSLDDARESKLFYKGELLNFIGSNMWVFDIISHKIPDDRLVSEKTVQNSLSTENNQITLEVLINISDMLNSSDSNTVGAGLKALSMLDYTHYTESIKYILFNLNNATYRYNKAANSTSVKFMFSQIVGKRRKAYWPGEYSKDIYPQDYKLFIQLIDHFNSHVNTQWKDSIKEFPFTTINTEGVLVPRIRE